MIETPERVISFLQKLDGHNYLDLKFAVMPPGEWFAVLRAIPQAESLVARVRYLPSAVQDFLSVSPRCDVRMLTARRSDITVAVQLRLLGDPEAEVRQNLVRSGGALKSILQRLASDPDERIAETARRRLARGEGRLDDRLHRHRSRRHWAVDREPPWLAHAHDRVTWPDALQEQAAGSLHTLGKVSDHVPAV
jgi:hypothetical protein